MTSYLITGGTGTLGRAFVKRFLETNVADRICVFSRGEHTQAAMRAELNDDPRCRWFIGDVRDKERIRRAMRGVDVVVHAAALKRVEVGQYNWPEMHKTNVIGTENAVDAAEDAGVKKFVFVSTDKSVESINTYGKTKALAEDCVLSANYARGSNGPLYSVCRYGNVFNSNGSVAPKWMSEIAAGAKEIEVRDRRCTRFFMHAHEAVDLVLDTIATMRGGEVNTPDLPAYCLGDLADVFSEAYGVEQRITELPDFEKRHESMAVGNSSERARRMSKNELRAALGLRQIPRMAA